MVANAFNSGVPFFDPVNFPHGFHRGGDFTRKESDLLTQCGLTIKKLMAGEASPSHPDHERMLKVIEGSEPAQTVEEKTWLKYLKVVTRKRMHKHISLGIGSNLGNYESDDMVGVV